MSGVAIAIPYCGVAPAPGELLARWNADPLLLLALFAAVLAYGYGPRRALPARSKAWFGAVMLVLATLYVSPFCALGSALFSARVVHHVLLVALVAPMLVAALPRARVSGGIALWTVVQAATLWLWHLPALYDWSLASDFAFWLMQASLLATATFFWMKLRSLPRLWAAAALFGTMVQMGLLGALLTFAAAPLYPPHLLTTAAWGLTPLEDQQLGGLIMWAPAAGLYLGAALLMVGRWLGCESARPAQV